MSYSVTPGQKIDLAPATREREILQNVAVLLATPRCSVPLDRGMGLQQAFLDRPAAAAKSLLVAEVMDAVERYEPRAKVVSVEIVTGEAPGVLAPVVEVEIADGD